MNIPIYGPETILVKITYSGKDYIINDGSDYFLQQIHKILGSKMS